MKTKQVEFHKKIDPSKSRLEKNYDGSPASCAYFNQVILKWHI